MPTVVSPFSYGIGFGSIFITAGRRFRTHAFNVCAYTVDVNRRGTEDNYEKKKSHYNVTFIVRTKLTVRKIVEIEFAALGCTQFRYVRFVYLT